MHTSWDEWMGEIGQLTLGGRVRCRYVKRDLMAGFGLLRRLFAHTTYNIDINTSTYCTKCVTVVNASCLIDIAIRDELVLLTPLVPYLPL